jgi:Tfp pilus assembly protein PilE
MRQRHRGITIVEMLIASFILGLLGLLTVALFRTGASGWKKMEAQSGLLADYEVFSEKISREVQRSNFGSASTATSPDGTTLAFLSAIDDTGTFVMDTAAYKPLWQKYLIFYWDQPNSRLYLTQEVLAPGSPEINFADRLENYDAGTGNLNDYRTGGRLLMTGVENCTFELNEYMLTVEIAASKSRYGDSQPETLNMVNSITFRN